MAAARAVLQGTPQAAGPELDAAAAAFGLVVDAPPEADVPLVDLWEDHVDAVQLFRAMQTQLRYSMRGVEGFDYTPLPVVMRAIGLRPVGAEARAELFHNLRVMECELITWHAKA